MNLYDTVLGTFSPRKTDDIHEWARLFIGREILWSACWEIEDGEYKEQFAMMPKHWMEGCADTKTAKDASI